MKIFKRIMLFIFVLIAVVAIAIFIFFQTAPQIGGRATGERLVRMEAASNYKEGVFENTIETNMDMPFSTLRKVMKEYLFGDKKVKSPRVPLEAKPFKEEDFLKVGDDSISVTWFGHSSILIRMEGVTILTDPVLVGERASMFPFMGPKRFDYNHHIELDELPEVDIVLISHDHYDHLDYPTIKALSETEIKFYTPLGVGAHLEHWGIKSDNIVEMNWWDEVTIDSLTLALTPTRHFSGRAIRDRFKTLWGSWAIMGPNRRLYFSGDSGYFPGFKEIGERYGPFDLTFMECGAYNEGWSEIHMFPEETAQAHLDVKGKLLLPIHWGKFDLSLHPWKESVERLTAQAEKDSIELFTPEIGEMVIIPNDQQLGSWWENYQ